jgi:MoaA/NifB/PqqE/SkfB family radical SAM enzyme
MMKKYKVITEDIVEVGKGLVNNTFSRFIGTADSLFSLFIRSYGHRDEVLKKPMEFIIIDKNQNHIDFFKELLAWDGNIETFMDYINSVSAKIKVPVEPFPFKTTIGRISKHHFPGFLEAWVSFKNSKVTFYHLDVIKDNQKVLHVLYYLPDIEKDRQFVRLNFKHDNGEDYKEAINNILHLLFMKSLRQYKTSVELADENNNYIEDYAGKLYTRFNPTFCVLPWMHIQYKPSGQAKLCCRYDTIKEGNEWQNAFDNKLKIDNLAEFYQERSKKHSIQISTIEQSFFSTYWNRARTLTLQNKEISGCHKCYKEEKVSSGEAGISMRLGSSILYNEGYLHKKPNYKTAKIEFLEVGFGNYCNLACLSCNSTLSTTWHDDEIKLNSIVDKKLQRVIFPKLENLKFVPDQETLNNLKIIKFTGGEPMINPEFIKFIDHVCENGYPENISLEIYTNCSYIPSLRLLENLSKFQNVQLNLSIDAHGETNDYIRYGSTWSGDQKQTVSNAINFWLAAGKQHKNIFIIVSTTLSVLNILEIPKLVEWWMEKFMRDGNNDVLLRTGKYQHYDGFFKIQPAHDPSYININLLPKEFYKEIVDWVNSYKEHYFQKYPMLDKMPESIIASLNKIENLVKNTSGNIDQAKNFLTYLKAMDNVRGNSCEKSIPLIVSKVKEYLKAQDIQI